MQQYYRAHNIYHMILPHDFNMAAANAHFLHLVSQRGPRYNYQWLKWVIWPSRSLVHVPWKVFLFEKSKSFLFSEKRFKCTCYVNLSIRKYPVRYSNLHTLHEFTSRFTAQHPYSDHLLGTNYQLHTCTAFSTSGSTVTVQPEYH